MVLQGWVRPRARRARTAAGLVLAVTLIGGCSDSSASQTAKFPPLSAGLEGGVTRPPVVTPSSSPLPSSSPSPSPSATAPRELPRGGTTLFPRYRLVGYCGVPGSAGMGRLGIGRLDDRVKEIEKVGRAYRGTREVMPVLELIAVVVHASPGKDGMYRSRIDRAIIQTHLDAARRHKALLLLNVQPGRAKFIDEVRALEPWLREPDVGLALDPEWAVKGSGVPGRVFGQTTGAEINEVQSYVSQLVARESLPQKAIVVHQLSPQIIRTEAAIKRYPGVALIKSVDGIGPPGAKRGTWTRLTKGMAKAFHPGFKLFYVEDEEGASRLMTPAEVMALRPLPEYVMYE